MPHHGSDKRGSQASDDPGPFMAPQEQPRLSLHSPLPGKAREELKQTRPGLKIGYVQAKRSGSMPVKQVPNHYNHGERAHKHCLICEGKAKGPQRPKEGQLLGPTGSH